MIDKSAIGLSDEAFVMPVERGKIREFARATFSHNTAYLDDPTPVSPPTFLMTSAFWAPPNGGVYGRMDLDLSRMLHGQQEFVFHGPPPGAGSELTVQSHVEDIYEKEGKRGGSMTFIVTVTEFRDASGTLVAESRTTGIETGRPPTRGQSTAEAAHE